MPWFKKPITIPTLENVERVCRIFGKDIAEELNVKQVWVLTSRGLACVYWEKGKPEPTRADYWKGMEGKL